MKPISAAPSYHAGPNMTPLVDVVMVILIFLMLAGSFANLERVMVSSVAIEGTGGRTLDPRLPPPVVIDVNVYANGDASIAGVTGRMQDPDDVRRALADRMAALLRNGESPANVRAVLHPAAGTKWSALAPLYDAAMLADFKNIAFARVG